MFTYSKECSNCSTVLESGTAEQEVAHINLIWTGNVCNPRKSKPGHLITEPFGSKVDMFTWNFYPSTSGLLCVCVCWGTCAEARRRCQLSSSIAFPLSFWDRVCHWTCNSLTRLDRLSSKSQGPSCLYFPRIGIIGTYHCIQLFIYGFWGSNLGPHECVASTLLTEPSPQSPIFLLMCSLILCTVNN